MAAMPLSSRREAQHGLDSRGLEAGALPGAGYGRFGRMFDASGPSLPDECLQAIVEAMVTDDPGKPIDVPDPTDENPTIPAGYTYFGQFIDHDITFDPTPLAARQVDVAAPQGFRTPALDLDCVYGRGPDDQPFMYQEDGLQLREGAPLTPTGAPVATKNDVPRLKIDRQFTRPAILGDKRNDENRLVAQLHSVFIAFHNKVVRIPTWSLREDGAWADGTSRFRGAVNIVRWHYQWLVLNDFLPKVLCPGVLHHILIQTAPHAWTITRSPPQPTPTSRSSSREPPTGSATRWSAPATR